MGTNIESESGNAAVNLAALRDDKIISQDTNKTSLDQARSLLIEARDNPKIDTSWNARVADMLQGWRDNPSSTPPLKDIVAVAAEVHGVNEADKDSMEFRRLQKVADIVDTPQSPEYHSQHHTRDVSFLTSALALRDARTEPMEQKLFLNTVTAAAMHDYDHDGKGNGHGESYEPFRLEHQSVDNVGKLLPEEMRDASFRQMREAVSFTDFSKAEMKPELESPAALLRKIVTQDVSGRQESIQKTNVVVDKINPNFDVDTFAASDTARMAKLVAEGDLMPSAGLTPEYTLKMTELLSKENPAIKAGPQSANGFLKFGCANMFVSDAAKEMIVPSYERNMAVTANMAAIEAKKIEPADLDVLKKAGNWMMGASDQANGGYKPVITVSIEGKTPDEIAQIKKVLTKLADQENGTRVIDGSTERGLTHPTKNSRNTISLEGGIGLKGIEDMMNAGDVLKKSGAGHFEWDDDVRDWKNNTQGKVLSEVEPTKSLVREAPSVPAQSTAASAKPEALHTVTPSEKKSDSGIKVVKTAADLEGLDPDKRVYIKAGVLDGIAVATPEPTSPAKKQAAPTHNSSAAHERRSSASGAGVGVGMGVYGLSQKLGENGTAAADLKNNETKNLAKAGIVADATAVVVDGADGLDALQKASKGLQTASKVSRVAAPVGVALSVASGAIDYTIAAKQGDGARAADAVGGTTGGIAGAAVGGVAGAKVGALAGASVGAFFGGVGAVPGAAIGGFIGGLTGAVGGAFAGAETGKKVAEVTIKDSLQKKFDEERLNNNSQPKTAAPTALRSELKTELKIELKPDQPERFAKSAPDLGKDFKTSVDPNRTPNLAANEPKFDDTERFSKSAPDLGKAFKASADPNSTPDLAANEPKFKVAANNTVYIAHGI